MTSKGCYYLGNGQFEVRDMAFVAPAPGEVLIQNMAAGICGTDVHIVAGEKGSADVVPPVVLGHEYAGIVLDVGEGVTHVQKGDRVAIDPNQYCGKCHFCLNGQKQLCDHLYAVGVNRDGGFAQRSVVPGAQVFKMNPSLSFEAMAMVEPTACCLHGALLSKVRPGDTAVVVGGGAIGQIMAQLMRLLGAARVYVSEPVAMRRDIAVSLGADGALDPTADDLPKQLKALSGREGADVVIECVGKTVAVEQAFSFAGRGARIVLFSVPSPDATFSLPLFDVFKKELTICGSFINPDTHEAAVALLNTGRLRLDPLITHRFPLEKTPDAIAAQRGGDSIKVVVLPNH